jgi:hypothetical protein
MREDGEDPKHCVPSHSKGAQRRRRLTRGLARWDFDRKLCAEPTRRVCRITLTLADGDPAAGFGKVREFWRRVRQTWLGTRYFCWMELQRSGRVHYHCIWLNPPHQKRVNLLAWIDKAWGAGRTQVRFSDRRSDISQDIDYALGYAKKMGKKSYQQLYDDAPRELRTFMSQRLDIPPTRVDEHLELDVWQYHPEQLHGYGADRGPGPGAPRLLDLSQGYIEYVGRRTHDVTPGGRCSALDWRRPRPGSKRPVLKYRSPPRAGTA